MTKRLVLAPVWFVSVWMTYGLVAYFIGIPDTGGAVLGALLAALIVMDPTGSFWARAERHESGLRRQTVPQPDATTAR
jgi:hypothetical protein